MSYLWLPAQPIVMHLQQKHVQAFDWKGRRHRVVWIAQTWRTDWGWWRLRLWRDYYKLVTDTGLLVLVYRDLLEDTVGVEAIVRRKSSRHRPQKICTRIFSSEALI